MINFDAVNREYAQPLDLERLARGAHMSSGHLRREFRRVYGDSPCSYLMTRRIERAMARHRSRMLHTPTTRSSPHRQRQPSNGARHRPDTGAGLPPVPARGGVGEWEILVLQVCRCLLMSPI
ncbi:hypothetical protein [Rhodococcoides kroppenstedtii]|uniref:hypothetical protein n=1 Tax=Rhodococcoides kroppenstedtii TaxID=293050 RepID=UPI00352FFDC6